MRHLLELCLFFLVLMGLPDWYIYRTYVKHWKSRWMRYIHWLPSLLLLGGMAYTFPIWKGLCTDLGYQICIMETIKNKTTQYNGIRIGISYVF